MTTILPFTPLTRTTIAPPSLVTSGDFNVRLAHKKRDIRAVQALRYHIFYRDMGAQPSARQRLLRRDMDGYDGQCAHLLLTTRARVDGLPKATRLKNGETVIGCYRLLRRTMAEAASGFYSAAEFDLAPFLNGVGRGLNILELGRSCVAPGFRNGRAIALLWQGLGQLVNDWGIDAMMGCASFPGTDPARLAVPLSYLHHHHRAPVEWQLAAQQAHFVDMDMLPPHAIDERAAKKALPPLLKGYLRSGAMVGTGAVIDRQFNTVDVFVIMPMNDLAARYKTRYAAE